MGLGTWPIVLTIAGRAAQTGITLLVGNPSDINLDARTDLIWQDPASGWVQAWFLGGPQGSTLLGAANLTVSNTWRIVGVGDFNSDGRTDAVWQDPTTGAAQVWFLEGTQGNVVKGAAVLSTGNLWRIRSVSDFNADGHPDLVWQDEASGAAQIWIMGGPEGVTAQRTVSLTASSTWRVAGSADFNADGWMDVFWQDPATGSVQIWILGFSNQPLTTATLGTGNKWMVAAVGYFDSDEHPDVVWQDPKTGTSQIWFLGGPQGATVIRTTALSTANAWRIVGPR
jgi:hypothetical protein